MRVGCTLGVAPRTFGLLVKATAEHRDEDGRMTLFRFASLAVKAAAGAWLADHKSTAMPDARPISGTEATVQLDVGAETMAIVARAADGHGLTVEAQLRLILDAAVEGYAEELKAPAEAEPPASGLKRRRPFDPAYYARRALVPVARPKPGGSATARLMGDPSHGMSDSAEQAGRRWDRV